jgi:type VI secretion system protein ImpG
MYADEDFLRYYFDELTYLREAGRGFARQHTKIAQRLEMHDGETADPHVQRLIESFAFLTARLQRQMNSEFPELSTALLTVLYPQLVQPLPATAIACFDMGNKIKGHTEKFKIPRDTPLFAQDPTGLTCRFRTCYDTMLWPVTVEQAALEPIEQHGIRSGKMVLRINIRAHRGELLRDQDFLPRLRFFLDGHPELTGTLYEMLFGHTSEIFLAWGTSTDEYRTRSKITLGAEALKEVGFADDEAVLPYPPNALPAYRIVQEYFNLPRKFLFFDVDSLVKRLQIEDKTESGSDSLDLLFVLNDVPRPEPPIQASNFRLGCTPIINLFQKTSEPIRVDHLSTEYRLIGDLRRESTTEIHSVLAVTASSNPAEPSTQYQPFYSFRHRSGAKEPKAFWIARRVRADGESLRHTDTYLSFVDLDFKPSQPSDRTVFAQTLCTNRLLATQLPGHAELNIENTTPVLSIYCLGRPTSPIYPPMSGSSLWRLISSLSLNAVSLSRDGGVEALREILQLYSFTHNTVAEHELEGICQMQVRKVMRHFGTDAWRGFRRGTEFTFTFDPMKFKGGSALLMAAVLRRFLSLYGSVNTFTQVVAKRASGESEWKRWAPLAGAREVV